MAEKICLDTDACIAILNHELRAEQLLNKIGDRPIFVTSVTIFELFCTRKNPEKIINFLSDLNVFDFDTKCAMAASSIYKILKDKGILVEFRDIFIASIAVINDCTFVTFNKKHFTRMPGLRLSELT